MLALDPGRGRVLDTVPGERWRVRSRLRTSGPLPVNPTPEEYDAPAMFLREYHDVVCLPRQLVVQRGLVLPETFTTVEQHRQRNAFLTKTGVDFAEPPAGLDAAVPLRGRWFHLDNHMVGHFGHALSEQLSHLWGWHRARELDPSLGALVFTESGSLTEWQRDLLSAGGVDPEAVHVGAGPLQVETLVGCTPMFSRPAFAHPAILATYDAVGAALDARAGTGPRPRRLFLDRRGTKRACTNAEELVAEFTSAGFEVVHPEDHPLAEQVAMVRRAEVVAGFAGSAMFHVALAGRPTHVVVVGSESYPAHNEYLMSAVVGHRLDVVACQPEVPRVDGQFTRASFHSDFTYRPEREGVFLRSVLAGWLSRGTTLGRVRIILHAGLHKSGTTSVQAGWSSAYADHPDVVYPGGDGPPGHHDLFRPLLVAFSEGRAADLAGARARYALRGARGPGWPRSWPRRPVGAPARWCCPARAWTAPSRRTGRGSSRRWATTT